jgi:hypothetical protein
VGLYDTKSDEEASDWMDYRLKIFDAFCYPSVAAQTNQNYMWLILLDDKTPTRHRVLISQYGRIKPVYYRRGPGITLQQIVMDNMQQSVDTKADYIITTRIDVDDMIARNFVQDIQKGFPAKDNIHLVFPLGYVFQLQDGILLERKYFHNQFPSYVEKNSDHIKTVWFTAHSRIQETATTMILSPKDRMWCWTLHQHHLGKSSKIENYKYPEVDNIGVLAEQFAFCQKWNKLEL